LATIGGIVLLVLGGFAELVAPYSSPDRDRDYVYVVPQIPI